MGRFARILYHILHPPGFVSPRRCRQYDGLCRPESRARRLAEQPSPFPIPPLAEQRRIVAKVEELLGRVNAARERLAKVPALLKRFRQSVLAAACSGQLTAEWRVPIPGPAATLLESAGNSASADSWRRASVLPSIEANEKLLTCRRAGNGPVLRKLQGRRR